MKNWSIPTGKQKSKQGCNRLFFFLVPLLAIVATFCLFHPYNEELLAMSDESTQTPLVLKNADDPVPELVLQLNKNNLYKEVLDALEPWTLRTEVNAANRPQGIKMVVDCLFQLNRVQETDAFLEKMVSLHQNDWRTLSTVADLYLHRLPHEGTVRAGEFQRGERSHGDSFVSSFDRDRVVALQLWKQAEPLLDQERQKETLSKSDINDFYSQFADAVKIVPAWQLQVLTDLSSVPDYEPYQQWRLRVQDGRNTTPVDAEGNPVFYHLPENWENAANDGQRWRFLLEKRSIDENYRADVLLLLAGFFRDQFGVQTLADYPFFNRSMNAEQVEERDAGIWSLDSLSDRETIARLATGIKRFELPDDVNYITLCQQVVEIGDRSARNRARQILADEFCNRRQYVRAAEMFKGILDDQDKNDSDEFIRSRYKQIVGNWGRFDPQQATARGTQTRLAWNWRNGKSTTFTARRIDVPALLNDVKSYLKSMENKKSNKLQYEKINFDSIGWDLLTDKDHKKYIKEQVAEWTVDLEPAPGHVTRSILVDVPIEESGAYLVTGKMANGNEDNIVVWISDTALVRKALNKEICCYAADAKDGTPVAGLKLDFFAYGSREAKSLLPIPNRDRNYVVFTRSFSRVTDSDGLVFLDEKALNNNKENNANWLITASDPNGKPTRFAFLGFDNFWYRSYDDSFYSDSKAWFASDRPVYRPGQNVSFKFWVANAKYDMPDECVWAEKPVHATIMDPEGTVVKTFDATLDQWGGMSDSWTIPDEAKLGVWSVVLYRDIRDDDDFELGRSSFRIEEYKKPEYEVTVEAPNDPVQLSDSFKIKIGAKYYFGAPVTDAQVKYTVTRTKHTETWYPARPWDWFYGNGYAWFGYDYDWYRGWSRWGCPRPIMPWWGRNGGVPEVVLERTVPIGPEGYVEAEIDSSLAAAIYPDEDQKYTISAEVVDQSRRTIVGNGTVLVAREPFKINCSLDRGYIQTDSQINAFFEARRIDGKPVPGNGTVKLFRVTYENKNAEKPSDGIIPLEEEVYSQAVSLDEKGKCRLALNAPNSGQYRLSCSITDANNHTVEGGYVFLIRPASNDEPNQGSFHFSQLELVPEQEQYAPGETLKMLVNTDKPDSTVLLFPRAQDGVCKRPQVLRLAGQSKIVDFAIEQGDMPNIFFEALTVANGHLYTEQREIIVPPEKRILNVEVLPNETNYRPGETAKVRIRVTDQKDQPVTGQATAVVYDKSVEYISGGATIENIKEFFWKWRRSSSPDNRHNLEQVFNRMFTPGEEGMSDLGVFSRYDRQIFGRSESKMRSSRMNALPTAAAAPMMANGMGGRMDRGMGNDDVLMDSMEVAEESLAMDNKSEMNLAAMDGDMMTGAGTIMEGKPKSDRETGPLVDAVVRKNFADTAFWAAELVIDEQGEAEIEVAMPENLTTWKVRVWTLATGTRVGEATTEIITKKNLIIRMQKPRFLIQGDEVVLSANVHNYLATEKEVSVSLNFPTEDFPALLSLDDKSETTRKVLVPARGEARVDWHVHANTVGNAQILMTALTDEESDAMQDSIPVYVHGILKQEAVSGMIARETTDSEKTTDSVEATNQEQTFTITVPEARRPEESKLTIRFSPSLAGAAIDALPYLSSYPYGCTEQTLNRFLPTVLVQKALIDLGIDMKTLADSHANLNAQELGDPAERQQQWKNKSRLEDKNPIYDEQEVARMIKAGIEKLNNMQCSDGGWGWFSGWGETSSAHLTALVLRGLVIAQRCDVAVDSNAINRGHQWLLQYQKSESQKILNGYLWDNKTKGKHPGQWKSQADNLDVYVYNVLTMLDGKASSESYSDPYTEKTAKHFDNTRDCMAFMKKEIWEARTNLSLYSISLFALALCNESGSDQPTADLAAPDREKLSMCVRMLSQYLKTDDENQTAWLDLAGTHNWCWWFWYGDEFETQAGYLKLLTRINPADPIAPRLVKYLLNNRKNATWWNSTRDTAICVEAFVEYLRATEELSEPMTVDILYDGELRKTVEFTKDTIFTADNTVVLNADELATGEHQVTIRRHGNGPLYYNTYLQNFTLEDFITKTGLEVKIDRHFWLLEEDESATALVAGGRGQALNQRVMKYNKKPIESLAEVASGSLVEVELIVESKNDYESILIEDRKPAGYESVDVQSGYNGNALGAYVEFRDERVCFFVNRLAQGQASVSYRLRAETPGHFSALPAKIEAMYAPELKGNSDEFKATVTDTNLTTTSGHELQKNESTKEVHRRNEGVN